MNSPGFQRVTLIPMETTRFLVKTQTLKISHFGKRPYAWNQIRTTFQCLVCPKYSELEAKDPILWYWTILTQSIKCMGLKSLFYIIEARTLYDKQLGAWISHYLVACTLRNVQVFVEFHCYSQYWMVHCLGLHQEIACELRIPGEGAIPVVDHMFWLHDPKSMRQASWKICKPTTYSVNERFEGHYFYILTEKRNAPRKIFIFF